MILRGHRFFYVPKAAHNLQARNAHLTALRWFRGPCAAEGGMVSHLPKCTCHCDGARKTRTARTSGTRVIGATCRSSHSDCGGYRSSRREHRPHGASISRRQNKSQIWSARRGVNCGDSWKCLSSPPGLPQTFASSSFALLRMRTSRWQITSRSAQC